MTSASASLSKSIQSADAAWFKDDAKGAERTNPFNAECFLKVGFLEKEQEDEEDMCLLKPLVFDMVIRNIKLEA